LGLIEILVLAGLSLFGFVLFHLKGLSYSGFFL